MNFENQFNISLNIPETSKPRVVIIGGGFGGLYCANGLRSKDFQVVLFDRRNYHTFQPLLYQVATAGLQADAIVGPLRKIVAEKEDAHFRMLKVLSIDPETKKIHTLAGDLSYDYLVLAGGMKTNFFGNAQFARYTLPLKTIPDALNLRSHLMQMLEWANLTTDVTLRDSLMTIVVVGGGPTGVEMAGALSELKRFVLPKDYPSLDFRKLKLYLVEGSGRVLSAFSEDSSRKTVLVLKKIGIELRYSFVSSYDGQLVTLSDGEQISSHTVIWSAGVMGNVIEGIKKEWTERGRILTDEHCRVIGTQDIFAIGDLALMKTKDYPSGHPGVAQVAIQMGKYLSKNLTSIFQGQDVKPFHYVNKGALATIGRGKAVANLPGGVKLYGLLAWFIWLLVHITFLVSFRNRILVMTNWIWNYLTYDKGNRLIIRPFLRKGDTVIQKMMDVNESDDVA